jgi:hypothetical protein
VVNRLPFWLARQPCHFLLYFIQERFPNCAAVPLPALSIPVMIVGVAILAAALPAAADG